MPDPMTDPQAPAPPEREIAEHHLALIEQRVGDRGRTDASTPLYIRVENIIAALIAAEQEIALQEDELVAERNLRHEWAGRAEVAEQDIATLLHQVAVERTRREQAEQARDDLALAISPTNGADWNISSLVSLAIAHREDSEQVDRYEAKREQAEAERDALKERHD